MNNLTRYTATEPAGTTPANATWWECPDCGDYAWLRPGEEAPECSCGKEDE